MSSGKVRRNEEKNEEKYVSALLSSPLLTTPQGVGSLYQSRTVVCYCSIDRHRRKKLHRLSRIFSHGNTVASLLSSRAPLLRQCSHSRKSSSGTRRNSKRSNQPLPLASSILLHFPKIFILLSLSFITPRNPC